MNDPIDQLVGTPFRMCGRTRAGADCWGLLRLAMQVAGGIELPSYDELYEDRTERLAKVALINGNQGDWSEIAKGSEQRLDAILLRDGRYPTHIGMVVKPGFMLHTYSGSQACIDRYRSGHFAGQIVGFYRHQSRA